MNVQFELVDLDDVVFLEVLLTVGHLFVEFVFDPTVIREVFFP